MKALTQGKSDPEASQPPMNWRIPVSPRLIEALGGKATDVVDALFLTQIVYWCAKNEADGRNFYDGYHWTYNSREAWAEQLGLTEAVARGARRRLVEERELVVATRNPRFSLDRKPWLRPNYDRIDFLDLSLTLDGRAPGLEGPFDRQKRPSRAAGEDQSMSQGEPSNNRDLQQRSNSDEDTSRAMRRTHGPGNGLQDPSWADGEDNTGRPVKAAKDSRDTVSNGFAALVEADIRGGGRG